MSFWAESRWGGSEDEPSKHRMDELLAELDTSDPEHPSASLTHESGWTLSVYEWGLIVWENLEDSGEPRHQLNVTREKALSLWLQLSKGNLAAIEQEAWQPGYSPPSSNEELAALAKEAEDWRLASRRQFYESLGPERLEVPCRHPDCTRGSVQFSVLCRVHHCESLWHQPCPFSH